ncbi:hypothetical protein VN24_15130 [Paenibacillus beijingensis]|uniref:Fungal lipase-like domain-containing protein n=2 Tax=Paenibacillus beijingensis TaxID=1126833 RepID=A0A0D5NJY3_9BACL|nr:hypothetical protein VN24_15130 [Paenibacillus beijingensis]
MTTAPNRLLHIYLLAGVKTTLSAFFECRKKLENLFAQDGRQTTIHVLFPYGDYTRNLWRQLWEVRSDFNSWLLPWRIGGRAAAEAIRTSRAEGQVLIIGHSGGGVAAYQAVRMLQRQGALENTDIRIVQIGSPKIPIEPLLRERVAYFHAVDDSGRLSDPISRIGSWGGWSAGKRSLPRWNQRKYAPGFVKGIPVIGGHANYFRHTAPYVDAQSICNLDKTIDGIRSWLKGW